MGKRVFTTIAVSLAAAAPASASSHPANIPWETYLPALSSSAAVQPYAVPFCVRASVRCIDVEIRRLRSVRRRFGCDHRGVFATTYLELTRQLRETLARRPHFFTDPKYLYREDALFANVYFNSVRAYFGGRPVPEAWKVAFDTAANGDVNGAQDMLLGINAHVQNDMPFVLAALGQRRPNGDTRKPDHDRMTDVLDAAYERVVRAVEDRFDPFMATTNASWTFGDDVAGLEMVKEWRELVWRNAERLLAAKTPQERADVARSIQDNAGAWARAIANPVQAPGHRAERDAYCSARLAR